MWTLRVAVLSIAVAAVASDARVPVDGCNERYDLSASPVRMEIPAPGAVVVAGRDVHIEGWCDFTGAKLKAQSRGRLELRKRVTECGTLGKAKLKLRWFRDCGSADGTLKVGRPRDRTYVLLRMSRRIPPNTFHTIEDRIFSDRGCAVSTCHGSSRSGDLDLRPGAAFASLVGVAPSNPAARSAGRLLVAPGDTANSFLSAKLHGTLTPEEGSPMPLGDDPLFPVEIGLIDAWIAAGAPESGEVEGAPTLPPRVYEETPPLAPPPGGFQVVLDGPVLQPGEELEGCLWVTAPTPIDVPIHKVEIALNPGTHHFAVWRHTSGPPPPVGEWLAYDIACLNSGGNFGNQITGAPRAPYFVVEQAPGLATILPGGGWYGLNAHYYNESSAPVQMKVWTNFYPYEGTPEHLAKSIEITLEASGAINVPPFTQQTVRGRWLNDSGRTKYVMGVGGHMHKRGVRFSIWKSDGTKVQDDYDWAHPSFYGFSPPYALAPGDWLDYECLHDNGVTRPVRRDYAGNPMTIAFGTSAEDEMCILTGQYYDD